MGLLIKGFALQCLRHVVYQRWGRGHCQSVIPASVSLPNSLSLNKAEAQAYCVHHHRMLGKEKNRRGTASSSHIVRSKKFDLGAKRWSLEPAGRGIGPSQPGEAPQSVLQRLSRKAIPLDEKQKHEKSYPHSL